MQKRAAALAVSCPACQSQPGEDCRFAPFDFIHHERRAAVETTLAAGCRCVASYCSRAEFRDHEGDSPGCMACADLDPQEACLALALLLSKPEGMRTEMTNGERMACEWVVDEDALCDEESRFRVERADADPSYMPAESCSQHLADTIANLLDGDPITATVTVHWDKCEMSGDDCQRCEAERKARHSEAAHNAEAALRDCIAGALEDAAGFDAIAAYAGCEEEADR
jgi:hypothetical protein